MGHEPAGKPFVVDHIHIYRLEGDRIAERWVAATISACRTRSATSATQRRSRPTRPPVLGSTAP
jgi:hypothetical protein